ncbi:hypothetical protein AYO44_06765 [Planctomycetaceae bacterium SCGC AG-212-F19]|nr:hypothetical protein AYO44_06765 [Planctomycetaceae bacterium SCGC AG-212-F19]
MLRIALIAAGVLTTAVAGYFAKRKLATPVEDSPTVPFGSSSFYHPLRREKKTKRMPIQLPQDNGGSFDPVI